MHRLQARRRRREDPRLVLRGHRGGRGDAGRNPAGQPRSEGARALSAENGAGLQLHRKDPRSRRTISSSSGRPAICSPPATAASNSRTARSARAIWRASRSPTSRRWIGWWNCTSLRATRQKLAEYERRQKITRESLPQLLTPAGYFVKSIEPGGMKHGVLGQKQFGYLEGVANADAVALRVVDDATAERIYKQIAAFPAIRPFDFLLTNAPGLDDTYWNWGIRRAGMEGYQAVRRLGQRRRLGHRRGARDPDLLPARQVRRHSPLGRRGRMKWAKDFRMDAPWSQRGENTNNPWSDSGKWLHGRRRGGDDRQLRHSRRDDPRAVRLRLSFRPADPAAPRAGVDHRVRAEAAGPLRRTRRSIFPAATADRRSSRSRSTARR